jgi:hypothetical protein
MEGLKWHHISGLSKRSEKMVLAKTRDGRIMVFKASILANNMARASRAEQPMHLTFLATHFIPCEDLACIPEGL